MDLGQADLPFSDTALKKGPARSIQKSTHPHQVIWHGCSEQRPKSTFTRNISSTFNRDDKEEKKHFSSVLRVNWRCVPQQARPCFCGPSAWRNHCSVRAAGAVWPDPIPMQTPQLPSSSLLLWGADEEKKGLHGHCNAGCLKIRHSPWFLLWTHWSLLSSAIPLPCGLKSVGCGSNSMLLNKSVWVWKAFFEETYTYSIGGCRFSWKFRNRCIGRSMYSTYTEVFYFRQKKCERSLAKYQICKTTESPQVHKKT